MKRKLLISFAKIRRYCKVKLGIKNTILLLSLFTGVFGATAAIVIKNLLHFTVSSLNTAFPYAKHNYLFLAFPLVGILLTVIFTNRFIKDSLSHGVSIVLKSISKHNGKLRVHNTYSSMIASSITVGFGGSVGLEAPMVLTGSAIGSNLARIFNLNTKQKTLLLACGSTAAIAAVFKAPVAAIVFAIELLMIDFTVASILPLLVSAATGTVLSLLFLGKNVMFDISYIQAFNITNVPYYIILGVFTGLVSVYFLRVLRMIEHFFNSFKRKYLKVALGGLMLGLLIFFFPLFYGEGYESINLLLNGQIDSLLANSPLASFFQKPLFFILFILLVLTVKVVASAVTTASGGVGGVFAPSLFVGAFAGYCVAFTLNYFFGLNLSYINFILAGMSGVMSGVMFTPVTAIFLIAEVSLGYELLIPLMITSSISYLTTSPIEKFSVYSRQLGELGELKTHNKDKFAIKKLNWLKIIDTNINIIAKGSTLGEYTQVIAHSKRNLFVVLDETQKFSGLLNMDDHRDIIFQQALYDKIVVDELMFEPDTIIYDTDTGEEVVEKFSYSGHFNLPVITKDKKYIGFLSKAKVLSEYRDFIAEESDD